MKSSVPHSKIEFVVRCNYATGEWTVKVAPAHRVIVADIEHRKALRLARYSFPNSRENYDFRLRKPRPAVKPLRPAERFARLSATYLCCRQTYRNFPTARDCSPGSDRYELLIALANVNKFTHAA